MQTPSTTDPSFQKFLEDLKKQNNIGNVTQMAQLKYEREMAKEDNDKREEQLDHVIDGLKEVRVAVTGVKLDINTDPLVDSLSNQTEILRKSLEEQSLLRKISEGSLEYDKSSAQYRNTSGRELVSNVSGKDIKKGGYVDFETASDRLSNQGKRVRESAANQLNLKSISYSPGQQTAASMAPLPDKLEKETNPVETLGKLGDLFKEVLGRFTDTSKFILNKPEKSKTANIGANAESDNIQSPQEIIADTAKIDLDVTKETLAVQKEQLNELKKISSVLIPSTPTETATTSTTSNKKAEESNSLEGTVPQLPNININKSPKEIPKKIPGKATMGSRILGGLGKVARILGPIGAAAGAAYSGFQGYQNTASNFDIPEGQEATLGQKAASTLGGVASGLTFGLVDEKKAAQNIHQVGEFIGEKAKAAYTGAKELGGQAVQYVKDLNIGEKAKAAYIGAKELGGQAVSYVGEKASAAKQAISSVGSKVADFFGMGSKPTSVQAATTAAANYTPTRSMSTGVTVASTTSENTDMARNTNTIPAPAPIISSNVNNINKTSYVPINPTARLANTGSALDQYLLRTTVY